jgi:hypothetical protein
METTDTTTSAFKSSIASIYSELIDKQKKEKEDKREKKKLEKEERKKEKVNGDNNNPMTKKEKREAEFESWKEVIIGLTGDDLDYIPQKKNKKKYSKWISNDISENIILNEKPKKAKKRNYNKEFEPEISMLKNIVSDQNKFIIDLQKRYQNAAGPSSKDSMPLNKNLIELAAVINNARGNSLGLVREIGTLKKNIADLYNKQREFDLKNGLNNITEQDISLMGSQLGHDIFGSERYNQNISINDSQTPESRVNTSDQTIQNSVPAKQFDPSSWNGDGITDDMTSFEAIPHKIIFEWNKTENNGRFKAIRDDNGEELIGAPLPKITGSIKIDEVNMTVKGNFDEVYQVVII